MNVEAPFPADVATRKVDWAAVRRVIALVLFLNVGLFKGEPHLARFPVDLTVLCAVWVVVELVQLLRRQGWEMPWPVITILILFLLFLPGVLWTTWWPYAIDKTVRFFSLTLLSSLAPIYLASRMTDLRAFLVGFVLVGLALCVSAAVSLLGGATGLLRLSALGAATIAFSRAAAMALIALVYFYSKRKVGIVALSLSGAVLLLAMIGSGSRGPLLSLIIAMGVYVAVVARPNPTTVLRIAIPLGLAIAIWKPLEAYLPVAPLTRLTSFAHGRLGSSELERLAAFKASAATIPEHPLGVGLGGFQRLNVLVGSPRQFPHNIVLEAWLEGGWAAGAAFVAIWCIAAVRQLLATRDIRIRSEAGVILTLLVFLFSADLVSGELNDSKMLFAIMGLALAFPARSWSPEQQQSSRSARDLLTAPV